ncbi:MAG: hypothetical protein ACM3UZ_02150 [Acidobacteriota bacterium]
MLPELTLREIQLLNRFNMLTPQARKEVNDHLLYVLLKQYRDELHSQVLGNVLVYNTLQQAARMCDRDDTEISDVVQKVRQSKFIFYQLLEKTHVKYADILNELYLEDSLKDWGRIGFESVLDAAAQNNKDLVKREIIEMIEGYKRLAKKEDRTKIIAV